MQHSAAVSSIRQRTIGASNLANASSALAMEAQAQSGAAGNASRALISRARAFNAGSAADVADSKTASAASFALTRSPLAIQARAIPNWPVMRQYQSRKKRSAPAASENCSIAVSRS